MACLDDGIVFIPYCNLTINFNVFTETKAYYASHFLVLSKGPAWYVNKTKCLFVACILSAL